MKRVIFDIFLFIFVFVLPWWVTLLWAIVGLFIFKNYYEFLISGIIFYVISTTREYAFINKSLVFYFSIIIFYLISQYIRRHIILYKNEIPYKS
jgi:hypothetical protein